MSFLRASANEASVSSAFSWVSGSLTGWLFAGSFSGSVEVDLSSLVLLFGSEFIKS